MKETKVNHKLNGGPEPYDFGFENNFSLVYKDKEFKLIKLLFPFFYQDPDLD